METTLPPAYTPDRRTVRIVDMTNGRVLCHLSWRASRWVEAMTADGEVRHALAEKNLRRTVRVGKGRRVYFALTRLQVEQTIKLLEELEGLREVGSLPDIGVGHDDVIFENAITDFQQCLIGA